MTECAAHEPWMSRALALAVRGRGRVSPNPMVGALIEKDGVMLGEGFHQRCGGPHAEILALAAAGERARGARLYVTLEPCCHHGRTPPCTEAILAAGIAEVVVAVRDPDARVAGGGLTALRAAGLRIIEGPLAEAARELNAPFFKRQATGLPWCIAKWAMSLDGKTAASGGDAAWVSGEEARLVGQGLRDRVDAILVGSGTVLADDPLLTCRLPGGRQPLRVIVDGRGRLPDSARIVKTAREVPTLVALAEAGRGEAQRLEAGGCRTRVLGAGERHDHVDLPRLFRVLAAEHEVGILLLEGGGRLAGACFDAGLIDELHCVVCPKLVGGEWAPTPLGGRGVSLLTEAWPVAPLTMTRAGADIIIEGRLWRPQAACS